MQSRVVSRPAAAKWLAAFLGSSGLRFSSLIGMPFARAAVCMGLAVLLTFSVAARADDRTWTGGGGNDFWTTAANWLGAVAPVAGDALFFGGTTRLTPENDVTADTSFAGITFNSGSGAFVLSGNRITLDGNLTNNAAPANVQRVQLDMILDSTRTVTGTGNTILQGILSGDGGLAKTGSGTLRLSGSSPNTYNGLTTVSGGTLILGKSAGVIAVPGDLDISGGARVTFSASGVNQQIASSAAVTMSGASSALNCTGFNANFRTITETIGSLDVTGGVFHTGMGTWNVTGAASFTGGAGNTIFVGNSGGTAHFGSLSLTNMNAASSGNVANSFNVYGNDGSTQSSIFVGSNGLSLENSVIYLRQGVAGRQGSRLVLDGNVTATGVSASSIVTEGGTSGDIAVQLSSTGAAVTRTFNIGGGGADLTIGVPVTNGASASAGIIKAGDGTLTLSGSMANTYTGLTTVSAGTLQLNKTSGVDAVAGNIEVNGGTLQWSGTDQVAQTASITLNSGTLETNFDTVANVTINNTDGPRTTWVHRLTISDTLTIAGGVPYLGSGTTTSANKVVMTTGGEIEMAANNADTIMNIGSGGMSMSDAVWHLGMSTLHSWETARINLDGDFEGRGTNRIRYYTTNGDRLLDLQGATRTFDIIDGTTTIDATIQNGGLTKTGSGTLTLSGSTANTYTGLTTVSGGRLALGKTAGVNAVGGNLDISGGAVTFSANEQIDSDAAVTMSDASSVFNGTGLNANVFNGQETMGSLVVTGGMFQTGAGTGWTVTGAASFTGGEGNTVFIGNSGGTSHFGSLSLTNMTATAGSMGNRPNSFTLYGNSTSTQSSIFVGAGRLTLEASVLNLRRGADGRRGSRLVLDGGVRTTGTSASAISEDTAHGLYGNIAVELSSTGGDHTREFNIGGGGADLTISVPVTNGESASAGINKTGAGTLTFSGSLANAYTGLTTVSAGRLALSKPAGVNAVAGDLDISGGVVTLGADQQIHNDAAVTMSGASSVFNGTGFDAGFRNTNETIGSLVVTGGIFQTGIGASWTVSDAVSFTGGAGNNTIFIGNSGSTSSFGSLSLTNMDATSSGNTPSSFTLYGSHGTWQSSITVGSGGLTLNGSVVNLRLGGTGAKGSRLVLDGNVTTTGTSASSITLEGGTTGDVAVELSSTGAAVTRTFNIGGGGANLAISVPVTNGASASAGIVKSGAGMLTFSGSLANSYTGLTTVSGGTLRLNKTSGVNAVAGDILVNGGTLQWNATNQVADTASITLNSGILESNSDTVANVTINSTNAGGQTHIHRLTITDTLTLAGGLPYLGSGTTTSANKVVMTPGGAIEMAANTGDTIMNIGSGGLSMSDAVWHLGLLGAYPSPLPSSETARINLGGNFEGSGTNRITYYTTNGPRLLDLLGATRTFDITGGTTTIDATIQNGGLTKTGPGTLTLSAANTYTGPTTVEAGTLLVGGSIASDVTINGGWLKGDGTVGGVVVGPLGSISAGNSPGLLTVDGHYEQSGLMLAELAGTTKGETYDSIDVSGTATFNPGAMIDVDLVGFDPLLGDFFDILTAGQGITNTDLSVIEFDYSGATSIYPLVASIVSLGGSAEALRLKAVPEPSAIILLSLGAAGLLAWPGRRRKRAARNHGERPWPNGTL